MSESKTKNSMIFNGFLFGLTASSTAVYGYALISHWAGGLQTSTLDEIVFIATILSTFFYGQSFFTSYQAYQRLYQQTLPSITMYIPTTPILEKYPATPNTGALSSLGQSPSRSSTGSASPANTLIGTPRFESGVGGMGFKLPGTPIVLTLPGSRSVSPGDHHHQGHRRRFSDETVSSSPSPCQGGEQHQHQHVRSSRPLLAKLLSSASIGPLMIGRSASEESVENGFGGSQQSMMRVDKESGLLYGLGLGGVAGGAGGVGSTTMSRSGSTVGN